jgi:hypothetical protein
MKEEKGCIYMKYAVLGWLQFIVGLIILGSCDYYVRWRDGWLSEGGSPTHDVVWFGVPILLGAIAVAFFWLATAAIRRLWVRVAAVAVQAFIGFVIYFAACLWYVIETGVDSL